MWEELFFDLGTDLALSAGESILGDIFGDDGGDILGDDGNGGGGGGGGGSPNVGEARIRGDYIRLTSLGGGAGAVSAGSVVPWITGKIGQAARAVGRWGASAGAIIAGSRSRMTAKTAWQMVQKYGPELVAGAIGMTVGQLLGALAESGVMKHKRRRGRGISARDVRTTKRVCGFVRRVQHDLASCGSHRSSRRRVSSAPSFVRQG